MKHNEISKFDNSKFLNSNSGNFAYQIKALKETKIFLYMKFFTFTGCKTKIVILTLLLYVIVCYKIFCIIIFLNYFYFIVPFCAALEKNYAHTDLTFLSGSLLSSNNDGILKIK